MQDPVLTYLLWLQVLWVGSLNQAHRGAFLRLELTSRQLLDAELSPSEIKMLCLLLLSSIVALLLHQMASVAPASLWPEDLATQPPLLGAALTPAYAVFAAALAAVVYLEAVWPSDVEPFDGTLARKPVDLSAAGEDDGGGVTPQHTQRKKQGVPKQQRARAGAGGP